MLFLSRSGILSKPTIYCAISDSHINYVSVIWAQWFSAVNSVYPSKKVLRTISFLFNWNSLHARLSSHYKAWSYKNKKHKKIKADKKFLYKEPTKATKIKGQRKAFYNRQRIPESSCVRKKTVDIAILVTSRNGDRKTMKSTRIMGGLPQEKGSGTSWAISKEHLPK